MTVYSYEGWEIKATWGSTTITGLQKFSWKTGSEATPITEAGTKAVVEIKEGHDKPVTGSFTRRFDIYSNDWIVKAKKKTAAQTAVSIVVQHGTADKFTLTNCIVTDMDYSYADKGLAEETVSFMGTEMQATAT